MTFLSRTLAIALKEVVQLRRDRLTAGMIVGLPVIQLLLFGYAINTDVRHLRAAFADQADSQLSRSLIADARASQVIDLVAQVRTAEELESLLRQGSVSVGLFVPPDFERRVEHGRRPVAQLLVDASDPVVLQATRGLLELPIRGRTSATTSVDTLALRAYYNPERRSEVQIIPGLIGVILTLTMSLFTAVAIVRERERGTLELLINTPVRSSELMAGKILPYLLIGLIQVSLILTVGALLFHVPFRGSLVDLYAASGIFVASTLALGLLISTAAKTQFQAFQMTIFFFLPSLLLSGFMFPFDGMPQPAQRLASILPLTHFIRMVRGIILRGASLSEVQSEIWPQLAFLGVTLVLAVLRFRKRLD